MAHTNANRATWDRMARQDQFIAVTTAPDPRAAFLFGPRADGTYLKWVKWISMRHLMA